MIHSGADVLHVIVQLQVVYLLWKVCSAVHAVCTLAEEINVDHDAAPALPDNER